MASLAGELPQQVTGERLIPLFYLINNICASAGSVLKYSLCGE